MVVKIVGAFIGIWAGSTLLVKAVDMLSHKIHKSSFVISFLLLGALSSIAEISVAVNSYLDQTLAISTGNLMGGIIVLFLFLIPMLAIAGNGIKLGHKISKAGLVVALGALLLPSIFMLDSHLMLRESFFLIGAYGASSMFILKAGGHTKTQELKKVSQSAPPGKPQSPGQESLTMGAHFAGIDNVNRAAASS